MMGDLGTSGDAPFGGEVRLPDADSQARGAGPVSGVAERTAQGYGVGLRTCCRDGTRQRPPRLLAAPGAAALCSPRPCLVSLGQAPTHPAVALPAPQQQVYWWHEKYRPRRPKYFNRVHTGYEWNKYNQTHYDGDNPPPKTVQARDVPLCRCSATALQPERRAAPSWRTVGLALTRGQTRRRAEWRVASFATALSWLPCCC